MIISDFELRMIEKGFPRYIYKYMNIDDNLINTLSNGELWFSSPLKFNDPFDCQLNDQTEWSNKTIIEYLSSLNLKDEKIYLFLSKYHTPELFSEYFKVNMKSIISKMGVSCFTISPKNMLMWSHYAASNAGVCLKFDIYKDKSFFKQSFWVEYSLDYPKIDYLKDRNVATIISMCTKSKHWSYEDEIRTIKNHGDKTYPFDKNSLSEIIFGVKTNVGKINLIMDKCQNYGYNNLSFKKVVFKPNCFDVEIFDV